MKKRVFLLILLFVFLIGIINLRCVQATTPNILFEITGTTGLEFYASYHDDYGQHFDTHTVPINITATVSDLWSGVGGTFSKRQDSGILEVKLYINGRFIAQDQTSMSYGIVSVYYTPPVIPGFEFSFLIIGIVVVALVITIVKYQKERRLGKEGPRDSAKII
ncbi:MAG: hypothetical protein ACTSSI_08475 [Candidatus Helarchaeota archaeon]